jgi:plastocyanin
MTKALSLLACLVPLAAWPASVSILVKDANGAPVQDAVAWATPRSGTVPPPQRDAAVEQISKRFVPLVTVVQAGARVSFPNHDAVRHHVYSFSPPKVFEIKLYANKAVPSVVFDKPGEVVLGCNIHDKMLAYVYVVDSPWYGKAGANGRVTLDNVPEGAYDLHVWHYALAQTVEARSLRVAPDATAPVEIAVALKPGGPRPAAS